jgi:hypothetical protein
MTTSNEEYISLKDREPTMPATDVVPTATTSQMTYNHLNKELFQFFREKDYASFEAFKEGYNKTVSEDYNNIDILCNLNDLTYNYTTQKKLDPETKIHLRNLCDGIQLLTKSMKQYNTDSDKVYIAMISGYVLKLLRNFFHD